MKFKVESWAALYPLAHPELRELIANFETWSAQNGLPEPILTDLFRTVQDQIRIYVPHYQRLQAALEPGPHQWQMDPEGDGTWRDLTVAEKDEAKELRAKTKEELEHRASTRWTWHLARCAVDVRTFHYSWTQKKAAVAWFKARTPKPGWGFLEHDTTGPHFHVERRDYEWRTLFALGRFEAQKGH